jgi:WD40 repeat protein
LNDEPVQACPPSVGYRLRKLVRRHRGPVLAVSLVVLALVGGIIGTTWGLIRATDAQAVAVNEANQKAAALTAKEAALESEKRAKEKLRRDSYFHRISLAHRDLSADNLGRALKLLEECPKDLREWEWNYLMRLCVVEPLVLRDTTEVNGVAFSPDPDGQRLASAGRDGTIKIWNSKTGDVLQTIKNAHTDAVLSVAFHREGQHLASFGADRKVKVWDLRATDQPVFAGPCDTNRKWGMAYSVAFSPDGRKLAAGSEGMVRLWDWKNDLILPSLPGREFQSIPVAFSRDGRLATTIRGDGLKIWNPETRGPPLTIDAHRHPVSALAFSPDDQWLASASFDRTVKLSNSTTGAPLGTFDLHTGNVECVAFSGKRLASGGEDKTVRFWDAMTRREVLALRGHTDRCGCVAFSPDGWRLASASSDRTIRIWDATPLQGDEGQEILAFTEHTAEIRSVAFSPDGQRVVSAGQDGIVKVWDATTGQVSVSFMGHALIVFCVAWHPDGERIASVGSSDLRPSLKLWEARTGGKVFTISSGQEHFPVPYSAVACSPDGRYLVTGNKMEPWKYGMLRPARRSARSAPTNRRSGAWCSARAESNWPRRAATGS